MALDDSDLEKLAMQEILKEAKRNADRAKEMGSLGWQKSGIPSTNKRFLSNMLVSTLRNPLRHRKRLQSPDSDKEGRPSNSKHKKALSHGQDSSEDLNHRRMRSDSRDSAVEDSKHRRTRSCSQDSAEDKYYKRRHSSDENHHYRPEIYKPYGRKYNERYPPRGRGQGRGFKRRNFHRNGEFPTNFSGEDMEGFYHMEYMEYMNNYKRHMAFYDLIENETNEKSECNIDNDDSLSSFSDSEFSRDSDFSSNSVKNSHKTKEKKKTKLKGDNISKSIRTDVYHSEKESDEMMEGSESALKKKKKREKKDKHRNENKRRKEKLGNSKETYNTKDKESMTKAENKRSWKYERADRKETASIEEIEKEVIVREDFNAACHSSSSKKALEGENNSTHKMSDTSGSRNMEMYKQLNSAFSTKCNQNNKTDDSQKKKVKKTENKDISEKESDNQSLSEGEILDSDDNNVPQDVDTSRNRKSKKQKRSKHRKHKHKKHKRK